MRPPPERGRAAPAKVGGPFEPAATWHTPFPDWGASAALVCQGGVEEIDACALALDPKPAGTPPAIPSSHGLPSIVRMLVAVAPFVAFEPHTNDQARREVVLVLRVRRHRSDLQQNRQRQAHPATHQNFHHGCGRVRSASGLVSSEALTVAGEPMRRRNSAS